MYLIYQDLVVKRLEVFAVPWLPAPYKALAKIAIVLLGLVWFGLALGLIRF